MPNRMKGLAAVVATAVVVTMAIAGWFVAMVAGHMSGIGRVTALVVGVALMVAALTCTVLVRQMGAVVGDDVR